MGRLFVDSGSEKPSESLITDVSRKKNGVIFLDLHGKTNIRLLTV